MMPMVPRVLSCFALLALACTVGCAGEATPTRQDATAVDRGAAEDLTAADHTMDGGDDDRVTGEDALVDAAVDAAVDAVDAPSPWGDAPLVDVGGYLIPVDPNAVPPPGSECVGDGGVRAGDPTIEPPRPIRPLSVSRVTSQRPTFQWALPAGTTGARVEVCSDRCCTRVLQTIDAEGTTVRPTVALPAGVVFWRMFGRRGTTVGSRASYTWEFGVRRRDAPNDTSWGTIRDFTGDGFDDLVVVAKRSPSSSASDVFLARGSTDGLLEPTRTGMVLNRLPREGTVGDFNGDGIADVVWGNLVSDSTALPGWVDVVQGSAEGLWLVERIETGRIGGCASSIYPVAVDWNGDGYSDIMSSVVMGCDYRRPRGPALLFVYYGSARGVATVPQAIVRVDGLFSHPMTITRAGLGDIDLDGYGDVFLTSRFSGSGTTSVPAEHFIAHGPDLATLRRDRIGGSRIGYDVWVGPLGDLDGDGHIDWSLRTGSTEILLYRYARGFAAPSETLRDNGALYPGGEFIPANDGADVNGDGLSDIIVDAALSTDEFRHETLPVDRGRVYVYPGTLGGLATTPSFIVRPIRADGGEALLDLFGAGAMSPGDVNADGFDDMVMRDWRDNRLCVFHGRTTGGTGVPSSCFRQLWPEHDLYI